MNTWTRDGLAAVIGRKIEGYPASEPFRPTAADYEIADEVVRYLEREGDNGNQEHLADRDL